MSGLTILLTNRVLSGRSGTELYMRDVALGLRRRGHDPMVYSPELGPIADELSAAGLPVVDDCNRLPQTPALIHGHHHVGTMTALLAFPRARGIFVSHDAVAWHDEPPRFPRLLAYVAVDELNRARVARATGLPPGSITLIRNGIDLKRFTPRPPLPLRPRRALFFSNYADEREGGALPAIREACRRAGLDLVIWGRAIGNSVERPEARIGEFDLVFGKARCALEAMAVGAAVVLCDFAGSGPLVTAAEYAVLRAQNFGRAVLQPPFSAERLLAEIARYDAADAAQVSALCREDAGLEGMLDRLVSLYESVLQTPLADDADMLAAELRAAADYLQRWGRMESAWEENGQMREALSAARAALEAAENSRSWRLLNRTRQLLQRLPTGAASASRRNGRRG